MSELAAYLRGLTAQLDPGAGWYGAFLSRDPDGMRACLDGTAVVPWDVLESLLQDLAVVRGADAAAERTRWAAPLRRAAVAGYDRRPGGAEELHAQLAAASAERAAAETAVRALTARLAASAPPWPGASYDTGTDPALLTHELSWTRDDLARATSRCTDLATRLTTLARTPATPGEPAAPAGGPAAAGTAAPPEGPRGTAELVAELGALRAQGRSGEAHAVLCEAAGWPAPRLPALARELERGGLAADWATLLWEAGSLPLERVTAAAAALAAAGRARDQRLLLRQAAARTGDEIADAALGLATVGREAEAEALLAAFVRDRTPVEAARLARRAPDWFTPRLLAAAHAVSDVRHRELRHALRMVKA
ncbi:hypothetical protein [Streptomyces sp. WAC06614]|uniref:hypothetical protein n=1 Tax=Streptomyces sp. WAC06614 TaxID=2487416 RepID=UPI000F7B414D|nr:hypothetical protein [Streptomyces sp. WAC06614]RSS83231.1 hypothetical protein EF918_04265 [Streptomyces sp. WAC06614]